VREPWQRINAALRRALAEVTLADLVRRAPDPDTIPLRQLAARPLEPGARD
jgi:DNA-binding IscR family transcriptional regulator